MVKYKLQTVTKNRKELSDIAKLFDNPETALKILAQFSRGKSIIRSDGKSVDVKRFYSQLAKHKGEDSYHVDVLLRVLETDPVFGKFPKNSCLPSLDFYDNFRDFSGYYKGKFGKFGSR